MLHSPVIGSVYIRGWRTVWRSEIRARGEHGVPLARSGLSSLSSGKVRSAIFSSGGPDGGVGGSVGA